jgi:septal ring factor EnvC (AmiA/AmiB activator)
MSVLKWTMESVWAAVAVVVTTAGGLYTTSYHWGVVNQQIVALQDKTTQTDQRIAKHDDQLNGIAQQNAATQQSLDDIKDTVHDIQAQVRKPQHGNNE